MTLNNQIEGAVYGALFSTIIGQIPPFTALPEEILTIPSGAIIGGLIGGKKIKSLLRL
mgnify:CR=1 FL=1